MKFELQFPIKLEPQSVLACFTDWVLLQQMVKTGLNGLHRLYTIKILPICHELLGKSGLIVKFPRLKLVAGLPLQANINMLYCEYGIFMNAAA
jgi:hypothetical protein